MSDITNITKKRKTDAISSTSKKARTSAKTHDAAKALVQEILADTDAYRVPEDDDEVREHLVSLALYARSLERGVGVKPAKTKAEIRDAAQKLANACRSGIRKQMQVRPLLSLAYRFTCLQRVLTRLPTVETVLQDRLREMDL
jgi:hypothetical protein